ncbi:hypothetical protein NEOLI_003025 [Neolecta irregularis DAH-3]|uniref:F-box domain-containing protein n=1 Tax=Neolecta irregularis (strain DAH-3) TaxID=1198029 RepID=A0A1U7LGG6_NEOID|nr:hypothetical protein NEOLI_003025 [Neolecta irregularis DAH-3]|eukprot:OLL21739.1 hypothetical protein NEOLI_003025 [Neolecta irregularis DAH-3]
MKLLANKRRDSVVNDNRSFNDKLPIDVLLTIFQYLEPLCRQSNPNTVWEDTECIVARDKYLPSKPAFAMKVAAICKFWRVAVIVYSGFWRSFNWSSVVSPNTRSVRKASQFYKVFAREKLRLNIPFHTVFVDMCNIGHKSYYSLVSNIIHQNTIKRLCISFDNNFRIQEVSTSWRASTLLDSMLGHGSLRSIPSVQIRAPMLWSALGLINDTFPLLEGVRDLAIVLYANTSEKYRHTIRSSDYWPVDESKFRNIAQMILHPFDEKIKNFSLRTEMGRTHLHIPVETFSRANKFQYLEGITIEYPYIFDRRSENDTNLSKTLETLKMSCPRLKKCHIVKFRQYYDAERFIELKTKHGLEELIIDFHKNALCEVAQGSKHDVEAQLGRDSSLLKENGVFVDFSSVNVKECGV